MILEDNFFVEKVIPLGTRRTLMPEEFEEYRRPFAEPGEHRRPTLTLPRELPLDGEPADVVEVVTAYSEWLGRAPVPKLFINAEPGAVLTGRMREVCRTWPNQREITVKGIHYMQEDSPSEIVAAIREWFPATRG